MKCQNLFSRKKKEEKNISKCCLLKILPRMLSIKINYLPLYVLDLSFLLMTKKKME